MNRFNYDKGAAGEALCYAMVAAIFDGSVVPETMRGEGFGALDLQLKYKSFYGESTFTQLGIQVKTGASFGTWTSTKNRWRIQNIDIDHIKKWRCASQPVLLVWVQDDGTAYCRLIKKNTPLETLSVSHQHLLTPATRFDIERQVKLTTPTVFPEFTIGAEVRLGDLRKLARGKFLKLTGKQFDSCLGRVRLSRYVWRHITRDSRCGSHVRNSLEMLHLAPNFLRATPHAIQTLSSNTQVIDSVTMVSRKVLATYRGVRFAGEGKRNVHLRLDEKISFPTDWMGLGLTHRPVTQDLKLESIFRK